MSEVRLNEEDLLFSASEIICCRICHEADFETCKPLESPCSCSGTVKFAHRDCVQRWCDEKGNTICEICLQKFEPGYSVTIVNKVSDQHNNAHQLAIRENVNGESVHIVIVDEEESLAEREYADQCSSAADTAASMCRTLAVTFTVLLLMRHFIGVLIGETEDYPFTILTLLIIKACGILLPMYIIMRIIDVVHNTITSNVNTPTLILQQDEDEDEDDGHHS